MQSDGDFFEGGGGGVRGRKREIMSKEKLDVVKKK